MTVLILAPTTVSAESKPVIVEPNPQTIITDTSPKLTWSYSGICPSKGNCFLVEVADNEDFSNPQKSSYTNNTSYSPSLAEGNWYWRVKAKNESGSWTGFSTSVSFTISKSVSASPTPPLSPPTPQASSTPKPTDSTETKKEKPSFIMILSKNNVTSEEAITIEITLTGLTPNTKHFIKPGFFMDGSTNYFGLANVNNNWIKNSASAINQQMITTDSEGNWKGQITAKIDHEDTGFKGSGNYNLKVGRYTESGSGPNWSNSIGISVTHTQVETNHTEGSPQDTPKPTPSAQVLALESNFENEFLSDVTHEATSSPEYQIATVEAKTNNPPNLTGQTIVAGERKTNWWFISSGSSLLILAACYVVYQRKKLYHT